MLAQARKRPTPPPTAQDDHVPAPSGGLNLVTPATALPPTDCLLLYNLIAAEQGLRARLGYREWVTGLTGTDINEVRSVIPFTGSDSQGRKNALFAATQTAIWDVSNSTTSPSSVLTFPTASTNSGRGISCVTVTSGGHFLFFCDEDNGAYIYNENTLAWTQAAITGVDPTKLVSVMTWKGRVWFTERDSGRAWYLAAGAIAGAATQFNFGTKFRAGGSLVGLFSWTIDGGSGVDDSLVAISTGGDVVIFQGTDPDTVGAFLMQGAWFVGGVPAGRRIATDFGGDLLILSSLGVLPLSKLLAGANPFNASIYTTYKITPLVTQLMSTARNKPGWSLRIQPQDNTLIITVPTAAPDTSGNPLPTTQLAYSFATQSWSIYGPIDSTATAGTRGLPIFSAEVWDGKLYFGTVDGRICVNDEYVDAVLLANPNASTDIQWSFLTGFSNLGSARQKRLHMVRPVFLSGSDAPAYNFGARFNLDQSELAAVTASAATSGWDSGTWDSAVWGPDQQAKLSVIGCSGMGVHVAIAGRGTARSRTILAGFDVVYDTGGVL